MANAEVGGHPGEVFRVRPEQNPADKTEKYKRVHYYTSRLGLAVSDRLQDALLELRMAAPGAPTPELRQLALKGYTDTEFVAAAKELVCIWLHQEAMDQGGPNAPPWIMSFFRLAIGAADILLPYPMAVDVLSDYDDCTDMQSVCNTAAIRTAVWLGYGENASTFAATVVAAIVVRNRAQRQSILEDALTLPIGEISRWEPK